MGGKRTFWYQQYRRFLAASRIWMIVFQIVCLEVIARVGRLPDYDEWVSNMDVFALSALGSLCVPVAAVLALVGLLLLGISLGSRRSQNELYRAKADMIGLGFILLVSGAIPALVMLAEASNPLPVIMRGAIIIAVVTIDVSLLRRAALLLRKPIDEAASE